MVGPHRIEEFAAGIDHPPAFALLRHLEEAISRHGGGTAAAPRGIVGEDPLGRRRRHPRALALGHREEVVEVRRQVGSPQAGTALLHRDGGEGVGDVAQRPARRVENLALDPVGAQRQAQAVGVP